MPLGSPLGASCFWDREKNLLSNPWPEHAVPSPVLPSLLVEMGWKDLMAKIKGVCRAPALSAPRALRVLCGQLITEVKHALGD